MDGQSRCILIACYGGGHVQSLIPVVHRLEKISGIRLIVIGFTTARAAFVRSGIKALGYDCLLEKGDDDWLELASKNMPDETHPDISDEETLAYFAIGIRDLVLKYGEVVGLQRLAEDGRKSFLPVNAFTRYLQKIKPDLVITSTSPRSELALQHAAVALKIESLAVSDLFLQHESKYICELGFARNITVMAGYVEKFLFESGYQGNIYITGNPAFDSLNQVSEEQGESLRQQLGFVESERIILWVCPSSSMSMIGKAFVKPSVMIGLLENYCSKHENTRYLVRQHPSNPVVEDGPLKKGVICPSAYPIETCLSAANIVLLETSTVGLQAALIGKPVVTVNAGNYPPYAELGLSTDVPDIEMVEDALHEANSPRLDLLSYPDSGMASDKVVGVVLELLAIEYEEVFVQ